MKNLFIVIIAMLASCGQAKLEKEPITSAPDYEAYLKYEKSSKVDKLEQEVLFWKSKLDKEPTGFTYLQKMGSAQLELFEKTGKVEYLSDSKKSFEAAEKLVHGKIKASNLLTLSSLAIKEHQFREAEKYALLAQTHTDQKFGALLMQYDAEMELGNFEIAESILNRNRQKESFDYLVRLSKFKDHEGNLDSAIVYMEQAYQLVRKERSARSIWAEANLGDMYGHAGRIRESYEKYLSVLEQDPGYHYALKGIAWIVYSADGNPEEAKRILSFISDNTAMPDAKLQLAEIAQSKGENQLAAQLTSEFFQEASQEKYQGVYNKYLIAILAEEHGDFDKALELALAEVQARPTPATYDWLAWTYFQKGERERAFRIYTSKVIGKTEEPDVLYHMGVVFKNAGKAEGIVLLREALDASYELGPETTKAIKAELRS